MKQLSAAFVVAVLCLVALPAGAQNKIITVPKKIQGAPFKIDDSEDLFGKAYRWFLEGETEWAADSLKKLIQLADFDFDEQRNYYIVVANFGDHMSPLGLLHSGASFYDTRLYGLSDADLYYVFISKREKAESFLSVVLTAKDSPFQQSILDFVSLFIPVPPIPGILNQPSDVWIDVRKFELPEVFRDFSDISVLVKKDVDSEEMLASALFDNTAKERWSFGLATAITTADDVDLVVEDGIITVQPKPNGDLAAFGVINYHFSPVDTKAPTVASSFHLLGGLRLADEIEPLVGIGLGFPTGFPIEVHFFGGISVRFTDELKSGFDIGQTINSDVDPFSLKVRVQPRFGIELKFP